MQRKKLMKLVIKILKDDDLKITDRRKILIDVFFSNASSHFDFDILLKEVKKKCPQYGVATLYRNLKLFIVKGIISENIIDGKKYYELMIFNQKKFHAHLICKNCRSIDEYFSPSLIKVIKQIEEKYDFDVYYGKLNFYGICGKCKKIFKN